MPSAEFFRRFGLFLRRDFLDEEEGRRVLEAVRAAGRTPATVRQAGGGTHYAPETRRTLWADVDDELEAEMRRRYVEIMPEIAEHFERELKQPTALQFLVYGEGDHFNVHRDNSTDREEDPNARKISALLFLNAPGEDEYQGGQLSFYGLLPSDTEGAIGLTLEPEPGLLVAFPAETLHGVEPVTAGLRYTVVAWYC